MEDDDNEFSEETVSEPQACNTCNTSFSSAKMLNRHSQICWNSSINSPNLSRMENSIIGEDDGQEELLDFTMNDIEENGGEEEAHQCELCVKLPFRSFRALAIHSTKVHGKKLKMNKSFNEKKFKAKDSLGKQGKGFNKKASLKLGNDENDEVVRNKFGCTLCSNSFVYRKCLVNHLENIHQLPSPTNSSYENIENGELFCEICSEIFEHNDLLEAHNLQHHPSNETENILEYICLLCESKFPNETLLKQHMDSIHTNLTDQPSSSRSHVNNTFENDQAELFKCDPCNVAFKHKQRFDIHTKARHASTNSHNSFIRQDLEEEEEDLPANNTELDQRYYCADCFTNYKSLKYLDNHNVKCHSIPLKTDSSIVVKNGGPTNSFVEQEVFKGNSKARKPTSFSCDKCPLSFKTPKGLKCHLRYHARQENNSLKIVESNGEESKEYDVFEFQEPNNKIVKEQSFMVQTCEYCLREFSNEKVFALHMQKYHREMEENDEKLTCNVCRVRFDNIILWAAHYKKYYYTLKRFTWCTVCYERFLSIDSLNSHQKTHKHFPDSVATPCPFCDSILKNSKALFLHLAIHTDRGLEMKSFMEQIFCHFCKVSFANPEENKNHLKLKHSGAENILLNIDADDTRELIQNEEPSFYQQPTKRFRPSSPTKASSKTYNCSICDKKFGSIVKWANHFLLYSSKSKGPYVCNVCDETFDIHSLFERHQRQTSHFESESIPACGICFKTFNNLKNKNHHYLYHIPKNADQVKRLLEESLCKFCFATFNKYDELKDHLSTKHPNENGQDIHENLHKLYLNETNDFSDDMHFNESFSSLDPIEILPEKVFECYLCSVGHLKTFDIIVKHVKTPEHHARIGSQTNVEEALRRILCSHCKVSKGPLTSFVFHRLEHFKTDRIKNLLFSENNPFICEICSLMCTSQESACDHLLNHIFIRTSSKSSSSNPFNKSPLSISRRSTPKNALFKSPSTVVKKERHNCQNCNKEFSSSSDLAFHLSRKDCTTKQSCSKCHHEFSSAKSYLSHSDNCPKKTANNYNFPSSQDLESSHSNKNHKLAAAGQSHGNNYPSKNPEEPKPRNHHSSYQPQPSSSNTTGSNSTECEECKNIKRLLEEHLSSHDNLEILYENIKPNFGNFKNIFVKEEVSSKEALLLQNFSDLLNLVVANPVVLNLLGFKEKPIEEVLVSLLKSLEVKPEVNEELPPMDRFRSNIQMFIECCIKDEVINMAKEGNPDFNEMVRKIKAKFLEEHCNKLTRRDIFM